MDSADNSNFSDDNSGFVTRGQFERRQLGVATIDWGRLDDADHVSVTASRVHRAMIAEGAHDELP
jgi:hypothetical protein